MTTIATLTVKLIGDIAQYSASMNKAEQESQTVSQKISQNLMNAGKNMTQAGQGLTMGLTLPILGIGAGVIKAASDMNETRNKAAVVFGDMTDSVMSWSKNSATAMGQSQQQALEAAGTLGNLFLTMGQGQEQAAGMSTKLVGLASDLASFNNANPADVLEAMRSGMVGMVEPLRRYGINMTEANVAQMAQKLGLVDANGVVSDAAKMQARYAIIMAQTTTAQGDFGRTSNELANSTRIAQAQLADAAAVLGVQLLPYVLDGVHFVSQLVSQFQLLSPEQQKWIVLIGLGVAAIGPLLIIVGSLIGAIGAIIPVVTAVAGVISFPLIAILAAVVAAIALLYVAWQNNWGGIQSIAQAATQYISAIVRAFQAAFNGDWYAFGQHLREAWNIAWTEIASINWFELGKNVILGILNGILGMRSALINGLVNVAKAAYDAARGFLGIHSESSLMREGLAKNMALGTISGWEKYLKPTALQPALASAVNMPSYSIPSVSSGPATSGGRSDSQIVDLLQRILGKKDIDEAKLARLLRDAVLQVTG